MSHDSTPASDGAKINTVDPRKVGEWLAEHVLAHENGSLDILTHMITGATLAVGMSRADGVEIEATVHIGCRMMDGATSRIIESIVRRGSMGEAA